MGLEVVSDHRIALCLAQMCARGGNHRHVPVLTRLQPCIDEVVVGQGADMKYVSIGVAQRGIESGNAKSRGPELRFPSPVGHKSGEARGAPSQPVVADGKPADRYSIDDEIFGGKSLVVRQPQGLQVIRGCGKDGDAMAAVHQAARNRQHRVFITAAIGIEARKYERSVHRQVPKLAESGNGKAESPTRRQSWMLTDFSRWQ